MSVIDRKYNRIFSYGRAIDAISCFRNSKVQDVPYYINRSTEYLRPTLWRVYDRIQKGQEWCSRENARDVVWVLSEVDDYLEVDKILELI